MKHEIIEVDESTICEKWNVGKLSGKLIAASALSDEKIYDLLNGDTHLSLSNADCINQAVKRILLAKEKKEKIFVGGDYDADGICSTAIMKKTLDELGIENGYYIPDRFKEGYGLSAKTVELAHSKGYDIIMTVDNGVKAHEALLKAKELGMYTIVTDHHEIEEEIEADIVVHPNYMESDFAYLSGAGVALELSRRLIGTASQYDDLVALCAVALIGDVMKEWKETRKIIRYGISVLRQNRVKPLNILFFPGSIIDETAIAFNIVPKLNAVGRMNDISNVNTLVPYLLSKDEKVISNYAQQLNLVNDRRKQLSDFESKEAEKQINDSKIQVIYDPSFHEGICGLVAGRLTNTYHKPVLVLANSEGLIKGSGRSVAGFNMFEFFSDFEELCAFGGHEVAIGLSIKQEDYPSFLKHLEEKSQIVDIPIYEEKDKAILIDSEDITFENITDTEKMSPYPKEMLNPLFAILNVNIIETKETAKMVKYIVQNDNKQQWEAVVYKRKQLPVIKNPKGFIGKLSINRFRGTISLQLIVEEILS